jgi:hypothetical protein
MPPVTAVVVLEARAAQTVWGRPGALAEQPSTPAVAAVAGPEPAEALAPTHQQPLAERVALAVTAAPVQVLVRQAQPGAVTAALQPQPWAAAVVAAAVERPAPQAAQVVPGRQE